MRWGPQLDLQTPIYFLFVVRERRRHEIDVKHIGEHRKNIQLKDVLLVRTIAGHIGYKWSAISQWWASNCLLRMYSIYEKVSLE
jgi:hypothetical protein